MLLRYVPYSSAGVSFFPPTFFFRPLAGEHFFCTNLFLWYMCLRSGQSYQTHMQYDYDASVVRYQTHMQYDYDASFVRYQTHMQYDNGASVVRYQTHMQYDYASVVRYQTHISRISIKGWQRPHNFRKFESPVLNCRDIQPQYTSTASYTSSLAVHTPVRCVCK